MIYIYFFFQIVFAVFSFAYVVFLSANHGSGLSIVNPIICRIPCSFFSCGVTNASDCNAGEHYVQSRRWCLCCGANCCGACVKTVGT
jgi:ABC-type Fe3+-siderophore transport system permease subunit